MLPKKPERYCVFDTEGSAADGDYHGCAIYSDLLKGFYETREQAIEVLKAHAEAGFILAAHNAEYDIMVLLWPAGCQITLEYYGHKLSAGKWKYDPDKPACTIVDSVALAAGLSVKNLGDSIGLPKLETPQRLLGIDPNRYHWTCEAHSVGECVECYAVRDAEIVHRYLVALRDYLITYEIPVRRKLGGIAVRLWDGLDHHGDVRLKSSRAETIVREGYHGGRVEAFVYGKVDGVHVYDVKSMYPSVMLTCPMPDMATLRIFDQGPVSDHYLQYEGVSDATVEIPQMHIPPLPISHNERLYFPTGTVRGVFTNIELRTAMRHGVRVRTIHRAVVSSAVVYPFSTYVSVLNEQRTQYKKQRDPREQVVKVLMNALYGRLGLTRDQEMDTVRPLLSGEKMHDFPGMLVDVVGGRLALRHTKELHRPSDHGNVLWAATITGYARAKLYEYLVQAGHDLLYCDTDGAYTRSRCLPEGTELGELGYQGYYQRGEFFGPKLYRLEGGNNPDMLRAKGVPRHFADSYLKDGAVEYRQPGRVLQSFYQRVDPAVWRIVHKEQQLVPAKRQLLNLAAYQSGDGFSETVPLVFADCAPETILELI